MGCFNGCRGGGEKRLERNELVMVSEFKRREIGHARDILGSEARIRSWALLEDLWLSAPYLGEDDNAIELGRLS